MEADIAYISRDQNEFLDLRGQRTTDKVAQEETKEVNIVTITKVFSCEGIYSMKNGKPIKGFSMCVCVRGY